MNADDMALMRMILRDIPLQSCERRSSDLGICGLPDARLQDCDWTRGMIFLVVRI